MEPEEIYLLEYWERGVCPYCANAIPEGKRVGTGAKSEGGFCSLDCYARYCELELRERHKRSLDAARRGKH